MVDDALGLDDRLQRDHLQPPRAARASSSGAGHTFFSDADTEVLLKGWAEWGEGMLDRLAGMFAFCLVEHASGRAVLARDRLGEEAAVPAELGDGGLRLASSLPALVARGRGRHAVDPVALHHYLSLPLDRAGAADDPARRAQAPAGDGAGRRAGRAAARAALLGPAVRARPERADWSARDWDEAVLDALRVAVRRRMVSDVPVGILLSGGLDSSLIVALLAEQGQRGLATFSVGFRDVGEPGGRRVRVLRPGGRRVRHRPPPDPRRAASGCCRRCRGRSRR